MNIIVAFPTTNDYRTNYSKDLCCSSIKRFPNINLHEVPGTPRPFFNEMLSLASKTDNEWFGWINGDCQLLVGVEHLISPDLDVFGLKRLELNSGERCAGVDGYLIRRDFWNNVLSADQPKMYVGGTHIDWWITRAAQKFGRYKEGFFLAHIPHQRSSTSHGHSLEGQHNINEFNEWAKRNKVIST